MARSLTRNGTLSRWTQNIFTLLLTLTFKGLCFSLLLRQSISLSKSVRPSTAPRCSPPRTLTHTRTYTGATWLHYGGKSAAKSECIIDCRTCSKLRLCGMGRARMLVLNPLVHSTSSDAQEQTCMYMHNHSLHSGAVLFSNMRIPFVSSGWAQLSWL